LWTAALPNARGSRNWLKPRSGVSETKTKRTPTGESKQPLALADEREESDEHKGVAKGEPSEDGDAPKKAAQTSSSAHYYNFISTDAAREVTKVGNSSAREGH
jgi:hypothetical protein